MKNSFETFRKVLRFLNDSQKAVRGIETSRICVESQKGSEIFWKILQHRKICKTVDSSKFYRSNDASRIIFTKSLKCQNPF